MGDYIKREFALDVVKRTSGDYAAAFAEIAHSPAADVRPVVRGYWEFPIFMDSDVNDPRCKCSVCGSIETPLARHKFCPNCGADMRGGSDK